MSARAAWRLEDLGFTDVLRYTPGKADWAAAGLPTEGTAVVPTRAVNLARRYVPTCGPRQKVGEVRERAKARGWGVCAVVNEQRILLGRLGGNAFEAPLDALVEEVMQLEPTTTRPNATLEWTKSFFERTKVDSIWVTTPDAELIGLLYHEDIRQKLGA